MFSLNSYDFQDGDLGAMLTGDSSDKAFSALADALIAGQRTVKTALDKGVPAEEFAVGEKLIDSYEAALEGLRRVQEQGSLKK